MMKAPLLWPEFAVGFAFVLFRAITCPALRLWKDWLFLLGVFGILRALFPRERVDQGLPALAAVLLAVHVLGVAPHALTVLGVLQR